MEFTVRDFGPIKDATLSLGNLTVICGRNNTGKTYLTYSLYNFLSFATDFFDGIRIKLPQEQVERFVQGGTANFDGFALAENYNTCFQNGNMQRFAEKMPELSTVQEAIVKNASFSFTADVEEIKRRWSDREIPQLRVRLPREGFFIEARKKRDSGMIEFRLATGLEARAQEGGVEDRPNDPLRPGVLEQHLHRILSYLLNHCLPSAFVITCERTGISVFRNEFLIYKDLAFNDDAGIETFRSLRERFQFKGYPKPIRKDLEFVLRYNEVIKEKSALTLEHPDIIRLFEEIVGGEYGLRENNAVLFSPRGQKIALTLVEGSSSVRSLAELNFYLKHKAETGQLLILDEPELNLHPAAQRKLARLLVRLANAGIRVFVTTHSDYFIREFNALMMLNDLPESAFNRINANAEYSKEDLLDARKARFYVLANGETLPMTSVPGFGIPVKSFDDTIEQFNELYGTILQAMEQPDHELA
jgi:AAA15 family ATPase/GTPase